jgi:hypothetical protein
MQAHYEMDTEERWEEKEEREGDVAHSRMNIDEEEEKKGGGSGSGSSMQSSSGERTRRTVLFTRRSNDATSGEPRGTIFDMGCWSETVVTASGEQGEVVSSSGGSDAATEVNVPTITTITSTRPRFEDIKSSVTATVTPFLFMSMDGAASWLKVVLQALEEEELAESRLAALLAHANGPLPVTTTASEATQTDIVFSTRVVDHRVPIISARPRTVTTTLTHNAAFRGRVRQYDQQLNLIRHMFHSRTVPVHFCGYETRFDETLSASSARLMPFRTHSHRPISMNSQEVQGLVGRIAAEQQGFSAVALTTHKSDDGNDSANNQSSSSKSAVMTVWTVEVRLRCLWLCSAPGAGLIRYSVPIDLSLRALVTDYCKNMRIEIGQVRLARVDMIHAVRYALQRRAHPPSSTVFSDDGLFTRADFTGQGGPGVLYLDLNSTLRDVRVRDGEILDLIYTAL